jgi:hypothetical protein
MCGGCHVAAIAVVHSASAVRDLGVAGAFSAAAACALGIGSKRGLFAAPAAGGRKGISMSHRYSSFPLSAFVRGLLLCALLASLGAGATSAGAAAACSDAKLNARSSGKTIVLGRPCDRITITLSQAFDGGYAWSVSRKPAASILKLVSAKSVATNPPGTVGGSDDYVIVYRGVGRGKTSFKLIEHQSFDAHSTIATFSVAVRVD